MESPEVLAKTHAERIPRHCIHYPGVLFNFHVMCLSKYNSVVFFWFYFAFWIHSECFMKSAWLWDITMTPFTVDSPTEWPWLFPKVQTQYLAPNIPYLDTPTRNEASKPLSCIFSWESHTWLIRGSEKEKRINVCSRWREKHLSKQWRRH